MSGWDWQLVVALPIVAWAVLVLARRAVSLFITPERSSCGAGCGSCSANDSSLDQSLVQLQVADAGLKTNTTDG